MENINQTSLHCSLDDIVEEPQPKVAHEFDEYIEILNKPADERNPKETEKLATKIRSLGIFEGSFLENMDPKTIIRKLVPFLKYEYFPAGEAIFHYEQPADKLYIIGKGKAREFAAKNLDTIEKESRSHYRADPLPHQIAVSLQELPNPATLTSLNTLQEDQIKSLVAISEKEEEDKEKAVKSPSSTMKKFRKMKVFFPFLKQMIAQKTATQRINDYSYKQSLRKARSMQRSVEHSSVVSLENLGEEIDMDILEEFKRYPKAYFIGGLLKVQFSRYLKSGEYCGLRALQDNALRTKAVIAEEDCHCISLHRDDFLNVMEEEKALNIDKINFFKKLFRKCDEARVVKFALAWEDQTLQIGDVVFQQNEPSDYLYALFKGEIILSKAAPLHKKTSRHVIEELPFRIKKKQDPNGLMKVATLCAGDFFGDADFFQGNAREFTATVSSARVKILRLSLKKYQETSRSYFDIYREIKTMTSLKLKFHKERFEDLSLQQSAVPTQNGIPTASPNPDKEKILKNIGHYFPSSLTSIPCDIGNNQSSLNDLTQTFNHKLEMKSMVFKEEGNGFMSPRSGSAFDIENPHKNIFRITGGIENVNKTTKLEHKPKHPSIDITNDSSLLLFSRAQIHRTYTPRHEQMLKKQKEVEDPSSELPEPTRRSTKRKTDIMPSQPKVVTRYSSIELLKKRVIKNKPYELLDRKAVPQSIPSLDLDMKLNSPDQSCTVSMDKTRQNTLRGHSAQRIPSKPKATSSEKVSLVFLEASDALDSKKQMDVAAGNVGKVRPIQNCFVPGLLQVGLRCSIKSQQAEASRSLTNIQMLSPKGKEEMGKENTKGFRILGLRKNTEYCKVIAGKRTVSKKTGGV